LTTLGNMKRTALLQNYPNPFNPETWIPYQLANDALVSLNIYDQSGHVVRRLDVGRQKSGVYQHKENAAYWDGRNQNGERVTSGTYYYQLRAGDYTSLRRMVIVK
jgi:bacillopeptidase F (M6 metalloprotease family)